jgi:hypothetical protein
MGFEAERAASALTNVRGDVEAALSLMLMQQDQGYGHAARPSNAKRQRCNPTPVEAAAISPIQIGVNSEFACYNRKLGWNPLNAVISSVAHHYNHHQEMIFQWA